MCLKDWGYFVNTGSARSGIEVRPFLTPVC